MKKVPMRAALSDLIDRLIKTRAEVFNVKVVCAASTLTFNFDVYDDASTEASIWVRSGYAKSVSIRNHAGDELYACLCCITQKGDPDTMIIG